MKEEIRPVFNLRLNHFFLDLSFSQLSKGDGGEWKSFISKVLSSSNIYKGL